MTAIGIETELIHQFDISFIDISSYVGLAAAGVMTANLFIGLLLAVRYNPVKQWARRRGMHPCLQRCSRRRIDGPVSGHRQFLDARQRDAVDE